jgi:hypothetical protein
MGWELGVRRSASDTACEEFHDVAFAGEVDGNNMMGLVVANWGNLGVSRKWLVARERRATLGLRGLA